MKQQLLKIQSAFLIIALALSLNSCSYTKNTGTSSNFNKKHYNKGIVKHKSSKKANSEVFAENNVDEKLSKKEQKEALKVQVEQYVNAKDLTASNTDAPVEENSSVMVEKIQGNFSGAKSNLEEAKLNASEKEVKKIDKKINRIEKFETMLSKISSKMEAKMTPDPDAIAPPAGRDLMGLLAGIFGITGFVFAFVPYLGYLGLLLCLSAIILGILGLQGNNRAWAITGIVLGALGFLMFFLALLVLFAILL